MDLIPQGSVNSCGIFPIFGSIFFYLKTDLFSAAIYDIQDSVADRVDTWYPGHHCWIAIRTFMVDIVDSKTRSQMMAGIRSTKTQPEMFVRSSLHRRGFRFGRNSGALVGKPDIVLTRWKVLVFVHGCFWHMHECNLSRLPESNRDFWTKKLSANKVRDEKTARKLICEGWRILTVWECSLRGVRAARLFEPYMDKVSNWIRDQRAGTCCDLSQDGIVFLESIDEGN